MFIIALTVIEIDKSQIQDFVYVPKSQIRENLNARKLPDLQYKIMPAGLNTQLTY